MVLSKIEWRNNRKGLLIWSVLFVALIFIFAGIYPQMFTSTMKETMNQMLGSLPDGLLKAFNIEITGPASMLTPSGFFAYYFQYMYLAACIYAVLLGGNALIKEESDGTLDFLYSQPVTRLEIMTSKLVTNVVILFVFWSVSCVSSIAAFEIFKETGDSGKTIFQEIIKIYLSDFLILVFFLFLGVLLSTLLSSSKQVTGIGLGVVFGFYILGIFGSLYDKLSWLSQWSPIYLGIPSTIIETGLKHGVWIGLASLVCLAVAYFIYQRKDFRNA